MKILIGLMTYVQGCFEVSMLICGLVMFPPLPSKTHYSFLNHSLMMVLFGVYMYLQMTSMIAYDSHSMYMTNLWYQSWAIVK